MTKLITPFRVGLLVIVAGVLLFGLFSFVQKGGLPDDETVLVYADFDDASGISPRSRVHVAGIEVGEVSRIELIGNRARIWLKVRDAAKLRQDASVGKQSESILGDYTLDLEPGTEGLPLLEDGDEISEVRDRQGLDAVMESVDAIAGDIKEVTYALRQAMGGEEGARSLKTLVDNLVATSEGIRRTVAENEARLGNILRDFEGIASDVHGLTRSEQEEIRRIVENVERITEDVRIVSATVKEVISSDDGDYRRMVSRLEGVVGQVERTLENVETVTADLEEGKGTVGALLSDEKMGRQVTETVEGLSDFVGSLTRLKLQLGMRAEYLFAQGSAKNTFNLTLMPRPDKYYIVELVDDPRGIVQTEYVQSNPPAEGEPASQIRRVTRDGLTISAMMARRYYFTTLRFGVIESTGGLGADLHLLDDALTLKLDLFNFSVQALDWPRVRASLRLTLFDHLVATAGMDDILNVPARDPFSNRLISGRDFYVGAGVSFTDEDLKALVTLIGVPSP